MVVAEYQLRSDLARVCLPAPERSAERRLAWVNSLCLFFLLIGVLGDQSRLPVIRQVPPLEQPVPVVLEPLPQPKQTTTEVKPTDENIDNNPAPRVVAVTINTPAVNFSVPTIGNVLAPESLAPVPPAQDLKQVAPVEQAPVRLNSTGEGGDRPQPNYPEMAQQMGIQGAVDLVLTADDVGRIVSVQVKRSSGSALLDHNAVSWVERHWIVPPSSFNGSHLFQVRINYVL